MVGAAVACHPAIRPTVSGPLSGQQLAELWTAPESNRDLFCGVGGCTLAPDPSVFYAIVSEKRRGYSYGMTLRDPDRREWSAKSLPEARTEVVASRLFWAVGYHQPPIYYLNEWRVSDTAVPNPQAGARFREKAPDFYGLEAGTHWSYYQNPFVGTPQMNGLLVLHVMIGSSDLKDEQNVVYTLKEPYEGSTTWYVARDLGQSFGRAEIIDAPRGDIDVFEKTGFITDVRDGKVFFDWGGRHKKLVENIRPSDVRWICTRLHQLTDEQWHDAFRAGGFTRSIADRFIRHMKLKIAAGLRVEG